MLFFKGTAPLFAAAAMVAAVGKPSTLVQAQHNYVTNPPTQEDFLEIESMVVPEIVLSTCPDAGSAELVGHWDYDSIGDCVNFPRNLGREPLGPRLVRLAFHDATGNMDGFLNMQDAEHAGLAPAIVVLDNLHLVGSLSGGEKVSDIISKADLFSWAGISAVRYLAGNQMPPPIPRFIPDIPVRYGREAYVATSESDIGPAEDFPAMGALSTAEQLENYFVSKFGFTSQDTVTLMGAHTLGQARDNHSGFRGPWKTNLLSFDEGYYRNMLAPPSPLGQNGQCIDPQLCLGWEQIRVGNPQSRLYQWSHSCAADGTGCRQLMLNPDIGLLYDLDDCICVVNDVFPDTGLPCQAGQIKKFPDTSACVWGADRVLATCFPERAFTGDEVIANADLLNRDQWIADFADVFDRMMNGTPAWTLAEVLPATPEPTPAPTPAPTLAPTSQPTPAPALPTEAPTPLVARGEPCPMETDGCSFLKSNTNPYSCDACASGLCGIDRRGDHLCRTRNWSPSNTKGGRALRFGEVKQASVAEELN